MAKRDHINSPLFSKLCMLPLILWGWGSTFLAIVTSSYISLRMRLNFSVFFDISLNSIGFVWIFIVSSSECLWSWSDGGQEVKNIYISNYIAMVFYQPRGQCERLSRRLVSIDEDPGLRIESFAVMNLRDVSTNKMYYIFYRHANLQRKYKTCSS
jgi:hypothetical protein